VAQNEHAPDAACGMGIGRKDVRLSGSHPAGIVG
jgi:hypothetical protein